MVLADAVNASGNATGESPEIAQHKHRNVEQNHLDKNMNGLSHPY